MKEPISKDFCRVMYAILTIGLAVAIFIYCLEKQAGAADLPFTPPILDRCHVPPPVMPLGIKLLSDALAENAAAGLLQKPLKSSPEKGIHLPLHVLMLSESIDPDDVHQALNEQSVKLIALAVTANLISRDQADDILKEMQVRAAQLASAKAEREITQWIDEEDMDDENIDLFCEMLIR